MQFPRNYLIVLHNCIECNERLSFFDIDYIVSTRLFHRWNDTIYELIDCEFKYTPGSYICHKCTDNYKFAVHREQACAYCGDEFFIDFDGHLKNTKRSFNSDNECRTKVLKIGMANRSGSFRYGNNIMPSDMKIGDNVCDFCLRRFIEEGILVRV